MKKSGIGCYGDSENLACVLEYLHHITAPKTTTYT